MTGRGDNQEMAFMRAMWEHLPHRIMLVDGNGRITTASPALEDTLSRPRASLPGMLFADLARDVAGREWLNRTAALSIVKGQLIQLLTGTDQAVLMRVTHVFDMPWRGEAFRAIAVIHVGEWSQDAQRWHRELEAITAMSADVARARDLESTLQSAVTKLVELLDMEMGVVVLVSAAGETIHVAGHQGIARDDIAELVQVTPGQGVLGIPIATGQPLLIPDLEQSEVDTDARSLGARAVASVPIIVRGEVLGSMGVGSRQPREFPQGADDLLRIMGLQVGIAVDNARLLEREAQRARELEAAVQELHHRVKNNLETLSAVLELAREREGAHDLVDRLLERIGAMAAVHGLMREGRFGEEADAAELVNQVVALIGDSCGKSDREITLSVSAQPCVLPARQATPLALITGELVSNALRHAFTDAGGEVDVRLRCQSGSVELVVADNGKGMPACFAGADVHSMGLQIVRALVEHSLAGRIGIRADHGTKATVTFPASSRPPSAEQEPPLSRRLLGIS
jgi:two-component sensor histidine kinase/putative methionine-R-sulfoxide reductase with GAF domain